MAGDLGRERGGKTIRQISTTSHVIATTTMSTMSFWSWDNVNWASQLLLVIFAGIALVSGTIVNRRQSREITSANERTAKLEKEVAQARTRQADAERELIELQEKLRPRHLLERNKFVSFLKEYKSGPLEIQYSGNDVESRAFASEIEAAFKDAGWSEVHVNNNVLIFPQPVGLRLRVKSADSIPEYAGAVQQAFKTINIPTQVETDDATAPNALFLTVGSKP